MLTLDQLEKGDSAVITEVRGDDTIAIRLMEMGVIDGEVIQLIGYAPLGDPIEFSVRGYRLTLRRQEAARVVVEKKSSD
jgi:ferrous iron transport protein A